MKENKSVFLLFIIATLFIYYPARHAGFVHDTVSWCLKYDTYYYWEGISRLFDDKSFHPVYHTLSFWLYKLFGINSLIWYFIQCVSHAYAAYLGYLFLRRYDKRLENVAFSAAFIFLVLPFQTDVVVWKATLHYLIVAICTFVILNYWLNERLKTSTNTILSMVVFFSLGILSHEYIMAVPLMLSILILAEPASLKPKIMSWLRIITPLSLVMFAYFIITKKMFSSWTGHYGDKTHLSFTIDGLISNLLKHLYKICTFGYYRFPLDKTQRYFSFFENHHTVVYSILIICILGILFLYNIYKNKISPILVLAFMALVAILPGLNLFVYSISPIQNDRFTYLFSFFLIAFLLYSFRQIHKTVYWLCVIYFLALSTKYTARTVDDWKLNNYWVRSLMNDYRWYDKAKVFVFNCFDNNNGALAFRIEHQGDSAVKEYLSVYNRGKANPNQYIENIAMYNPKTDKDLIRLAEKTDSVTYKIVIPDGTWYWSVGRGAKPQDNAVYQTTIDEWNVGMTLRFKQPIDTTNTVIIYQYGDTWRLID